MIQLTRGIWGRSFSCWGSPSCDLFGNMCFLILIGIIEQLLKSIEYLNFKQSTTWFSWFSLSSRTWMIFSSWHVVLIQLYIKKHAFLILFFRISFPRLKYAEPYSIKNDLFFVKIFPKAIPQRHPIIIDKVIPIFLSSPGSLTSGWST